jgi:alpha-amylase/alpha-mannosidase (GH57 family)
MQISSEISSQRNVKSIFDKDTRALIVHGHFYQPPRENPWTGIVDEEPDAAPFHDWNERIYAECYRANAQVSFIDQRTGVQRFVNNYAHLSFNFGPTLLTWLKRMHPETHAQIIAADAASARLRGGHGNAIAQAYSHAILPLCNERDRRTQVRWGLADFRHRFQREPEAMWLPETACNNDVLDLLIDEGMRYVILAPRQAARVRHAPETEWQDITPGAVNTGIAYQYCHRNDPARSIAVFFYDQQLAGAIAFDRALTSSAQLVELFAESGRDGGLVNVATDGESYGHHFKFGDLCLAHAFEVEVPARGLRATNYGEYLDHHPPAAEIEIDHGPDGEGSSWSCTHGVGRWIRDCGCQTDGAAGWNQSWRGPLRNALDLVRDEAAAYFEATRGTLFIDPWDARDDAVDLILDPDRSSEFMRRQAPRNLTLPVKERALMFLEMQRNTILMYASCGWFFNDISRIEPVQVLKYAARAIDLMDKLGLPFRRRSFLELLAEAHSNKTEMGNGADIYRQLVETANPANQPADILI